MKGTVTTRSASTPPRIIPAVNPGRSIARIASPSYQSSTFWNCSLNLASNRLKKLFFDPSPLPSASCRRMNFAQYNGTTVIAKKYDAKMESTTPSAIGVKMYLLTPEKNVTGKNTIEVVNVAASTAIETSVPPISDATCGDSPISI